MALKKKKMKQKMQQKMRRIETPMKNVEAAKAGVRMVLKSWKGKQTSLLPINSKSQFTGMLKIANKLG